MRVEGLQECFDEKVFRSDAIWFEVYGLVATGELQNEDQLIEHARKKAAYFSDYSLKRLKQNVLDAMNDDDPRIVKKAEALLIDAGLLINLNVKR